MTLQAETPLAAPIQAPSNLDLIRLHSEGRLFCGNCAAWRKVTGTDGECWSGDRLDGDFSKGPAGITTETQFCEAWTGCSPALKEYGAPTGACRSPLARKAPSLYDFRTGKWNHKGLRVNAVYRLLRKQRIGKTRALELLAQRHTSKEMKILRSTVELWKEPIKDMLP